MEEIENIGFNEVMGIIEGFPLKPRKYRVVVTLNMTEEDELSLEENSGGMSDIQYVIATGDRIEDLKPGQKVMLDLQKLTKMVESPTNPNQRIPAIELVPLYVDGRAFAVVDDNVITMIDTRE